MIAVGQANTKASARSAAQTGPAHESSNAMTTTPVAAPLQPARHAWTAVGVATFLVRLRDQCQQRRVGLRPRSRVASDPGVITAARNVQCPAQHGDGVIHTYGSDPFKALSAGAERMPKVDGTALNVGAVC